MVEFFLEVEFKGGIPLRRSGPYVRLERAELAMTALLAREDVLKVELKPTSGVTGAELKGAWA